MQSGFKSNETVRNEVILLVNSAVSNPQLKLLSKLFSQFFEPTAMHFRSDLESY